MKHKPILAIIMMFLLLFSAACDQHIEGSKIEEGISNIVIDPTQGALNTSTQKVICYYANEDYTMLVGETVEIEIPVSSQKEYVILETLIYGPQTIGTNLNTVINPQTKIIDIEEFEEYISITLSEDFLDWSFISETNLSVEALNCIKRLSVYAIVNTIIESSLCTKVQILVDKEGSNTGQRITLSEVGMGGAGILEPLGRSGDVVLSAQKTLDNLFNAMIDEDYSEVYGYIAYMDEENGQRPLENSFSAWIQSRNISVESYQINEEVETVERETTILMVDYVINISGEGRKEFTNIPVKLIKENALWKMTYPMMQELF